MYSVGGSNASNVAWGRVATRLYVPAGAPEYQPNYARGTRKEVA